jgi:hypothetical protein
VLLVERQLVLLEELVERQLLAQLAVMQPQVQQMLAHLQVLRVGSKLIEMQLVSKLLLVMILEPAECHPLVHRLPVLWLLLMKLALLASMF